MTSQTRPDPQIPVPADPCPWRRRLAAGHGRAHDRRPERDRARRGTTILDACAALGIETPTLCYLET